MIEKHIVLEDIDPVIFYGVNNANMQMIKALFPKLRIVARGNVIKSWETRRKCALSKRPSWPWRSTACSTTRSTKK